MEKAENSEHANKMTLYRGGSGLVSSISDYAKFGTMLLNNGLYNGKRILSEASVRRMTTNQLPNKFIGGDHHVENRGWGMGLWVGKLDSNRRGIFSSNTYGKFGGSDCVLFWVDKDRELIYLVFHQTDNSYSVVHDFIKMVYSNSRAH